MNSSTSNSDSTNSSNDDEFYQDVSIACVMSSVSEWLKYVDKEPCRTSSHTRYKLLMHVLNGHEIRCHEQFRMQKQVFKELLTTLKSSYGLKEGSSVSIVEALTMFLIILGHE